MPQSLIDQIVEAAKRAHPGLSTSTEALRELLCRRFLDQPDPIRDLLRVREHAGDVYLALACSNGESQALQQFDSDIAAQTGKLVSRFRLSADQLSDLTQRLRMHILLTPSGRSPRIASYSGRGRLLDWYRVLALREAALLSQRDATATRHNLEGVLERVLRQRGEPAGQERTHLWARYAEPARHALRQSLMALSSAERNLLRWHFVDGLNGTQLGALLGRNRSSIHRRIVALLDRLHGDVIQRLSQTLNLPTDEIDSLLRTLRSQLEIGLSDLLSDLD